MKIILVTGVIGGGKDYFAEEYVKEHPDENVRVLRFASPLRSIVEEMFKIDKDEASYTKWKSIPANRKFMVDLGQSMKSVFGKDFFARQLVERNGLNMTFWSPITILIPDFRFPIELETLLERTMLNGKKVDIVFCDYPSERYELLPEQESERMALFLKKRGYNHRQIISVVEFLNLMKEYEG